MANLILKSLQDLSVPVLRGTDPKTPNTLAGDTFNFIPGLTRGNIRINDQTALSLSAVFNAVDQISNDIAKLPKGVFYRNEKGRFRNRNHPVDRLISKRPNRQMTQFSFHKSLMIQAMLRGNGVALIDRNPTTGIQTGFQLIPDEDLLDIRKKDGQLFYKIRFEKVVKWYDGEDLVHIPGFSFNGVYGINIFRYAAQNMGAAISAEAFASENFKSKGLLAGIIKTDKQVKKAAKDGLSNAMEARLGKGGSHNIGFLDENMSFQEIKSNAQEAALIDWKKISIEDVARWFNIAPHKIKHLDKATFSNIEQQSIEHGSDTIAPWVKRIEEEYDVKLFSEFEADTYVKFNTNALIRTDIKTKGEYYSRAVNFGWKTRNEIRDLEDDNRLDGLDQPLTPANTKTLEEFEKESENGN